MIVLALVDFISQHATAKENREYRRRKFERPGLTATEIDEIKEAFALFDDRKDGAATIASCLFVIVSLFML